VTVPSSLTWRTGEGWLVLAGGTAGRWPATEAIDRAAIAAIRRPGPTVFLPAAGCAPDYGESFTARYRALGAPNARVAPVHGVVSARDPANAALLRGASLIYIGGGETPQLLASMASSPALEALAGAYTDGAVIVGMSAGAIALASWGLSIDPGVGLLEGWGWLPDVVVAPHYTPARARELEAALAQRLASVALGLPEHVALGLGPGGEIETWGADQIAVISAAPSRTQR
jgi:peptidase E